MYIYIARYLGGGRGFLRGEKREKVYYYYKSKYFDNIFINLGEKIYKYI